VLPDAERVGALVAELAMTIATAESLTGGAVAEALVEVPGSGDWLAGGVVAYHSRVKHDLLGVKGHRVVSATAVREMAQGAAALLNTDVGIATTGCAGPASMDGQPVGTVWVGISIPGGTIAEHHFIEGDPEQIRRGAVQCALAAAASLLERGKRTGP